MGTKKNPGRFDCYTSARDDEPLFALLGRDIDAPILVRAWALLRQARGESAEVVSDANNCVAAMVVELNRLGKTPTTIHELLDVLKKC